MMQTFSNETRLIMCALKCFDVVRFFSVFVAVLQCLVDAQVLLHDIVQSGSLVQLTTLTGS